MDSTRLPGKILEEIDGLPAIMHTTRRVMESRLHPLVVCPAKDRPAIVEALRLPSDSWNIFGWDGPEDDVLGRFVAALDAPPFPVGGVVRVTADCPWVDISTISIVAGFLDTGQPDFVTTNAVEGEPSLDGYDVEGFTRELLVEAAALPQLEVMDITEMGDSEPRARTTLKIPDREHVTPWMRRNAKRPWVIHRLGPPDGRRWTLDTPEDLEWFRAVAAEINVQPPEHPTYENLRALEERRPDLIRRNG
jgi:spore coat polysaccharide biosynthesis protein SpsF (cytidylyltransferase family)